MSPITKKLDLTIENVKKLGERIGKSDVEDKNTKTTAIENTTGSQSLRDTLTLMKRSKISSKSKKNQMGYNLEWRICSVTW